MARLDGETAFAALKEIKAIEVWVDQRDGACWLGFRYMPLNRFRSKAFAILLGGAEKTRRKMRREVSKAQRAEIMNHIVQFSGAGHSFERRSRKIVYARMMAELRKKLPAMPSELMETLAGGALSQGRRRAGGNVSGLVEFNPAWNLATMREVVKYRNHRFPVLEIKSPEDVERHVLRHLDTLQFTNRRMVRRYVLNRRYYALL